MDGNTYKTEDIVLAASLKALGFPMTNITLIGNKGTFHFENIPPEVVVSYDLGNMRIEPQSLNSQIKALTTATRRI